MIRMGRTLLSAAFALTIGIMAAEGADAHRINDLRGLQMNHAKIPVFNKSQLQMVVFAGSAERRGEVMVGVNTVLEIIRSGADMDAINDGWDLKPYPLGAKLVEVLDFWKERISYSDGVMNTPECEIDQIGRRAFGNRDVHFRSPMLDLDGVGFEADFDRRTISVNSQVKIVIRQGSADPAVLLKTPGQLPAKYEYITAAGDSMLIDSARNEVMLIGHVRVDEERMFLTCDRLTVFWGGEKDKDKKESKGNAPAPDLKSSGVDRILADGEVVITRKDNPAEQVFADHLVCNVTKGTLKLTGDTELPRIVSANGAVLCGRTIFLERDTKRGLITGGCRIDGAPERDENGKRIVRQSLTSETGFFDAANNFNDFNGDVRMRDGDRSIACDRMRVITAEHPDRAKKPAKAPAADTGVSSMFDSGDFGGSREIKSAEFHGNVVLTDAGSSRLSCEEMQADFAPTAAGKTELATAKWFRRVRVETLGGEAGAAPGVLTANRGELDNRADRVTFVGKVKGRRLNSTLDCRRLDIYLGRKKSAPGDSAAADKSAAGKSPVTGSIAAGTGGDRAIRKTVATGNVRVTDASGKLDCDKLSLYFTELAAGEKPAPGMFQSGGAKLTDIVAEGNVVATSRSSAKSQVASGLFSGKSSGDRVLHADRGRADLTRNISHFSGNVSINDDENRMLCKDMYLFGVKHRPEPQVPGARPAEDPDADPFALTEFTEDTVPAAINITDDVRLQRVLCLGDVKLERTDPDTKLKQEAGGDRCEYLTDTRYVTMTAVPPRRPWLRAEGRQQYASRIVYDLGENVFKSYDTDTFTLEK